MKKICFFIGPIGDDHSPIRDWSDQILEYIVSPTIKEFDYEKPIRADLISGASSISFEIIKNLVDADLVIADLTNGNPNAFYELALRHVLKRPVVHIIREGEKIPFDVRDIPVISVNIDSPRQTEKSKKAVKAQVKALEEKKIFSITHIELINDVKTVSDSHRSGKEKEELFNLLERLDNIQFSINELKGDVATLIRQLVYTKGKDLTESTFRETRLKKAELIKQKSEKKKKAS